MDTKTCYRFKEDTGELLGSEMAFCEPKGGTFPLPANCTFIEPPIFAEFEIPAFDGEKWDIKPDYRKHIRDGQYVGGKPFYDPSQYWWAEGKYMTKIGDIPEGMTFVKMDKPQIVIEVVALMDEIQEKKKYLSETDYIHNVIAEEPDKAEKYAPVIEERKSVRASIDPMQERIDQLKAEIVEKYGKDALDHLL